MNEYIYLIDDLIESIDKSLICRKLKEKKELLYSDEEIKLLKENNNKKSFDDNEKVKEFRSLENEVNFLILDINKKIKENL